MELLKKEQFDSLYHLMEVSFPIDEYRTYEEQKELFDDPRYRVYVLRDEEEIKAFIALWEFATFYFIEHFAVNPKFRNAGLGSAILKELTGELTKAVCLEVEPPAEEMARRRIGFYERNGFFLNEYPYSQPPISEGRKEIPLQIMTSEGRVSREQFGEIKHTLYREVYHLEG